MPVGHVRINDPRPNPVRDSHALAFPRLPQCSLALRTCAWSPIRSYQRTSDSRPRLLQNDNITFIRVLEDRPDSDQVSFHTAAIMRVIAKPLYSFLSMLSLELR